MVKTEKSIRIFVLREKPEVWKERGKFSFRIIPPDNINIGKAPHGKEGYFVYGKDIKQLNEILNKVSEEIIRKRWNKNDFFPPISPFT